MTTLKQVIDRTRVRLMGQQREPINVLAASISSSETAITLTNSVRFIEGARLCIGTETTLVTAVSGTGNGATIIRGIDGSIPVAHTSGDLVFVDPTWTSTEILGAINDELSDLSSPVNGLFRIRTATDIIYNPSQAGYNLAGLVGLIDVWRVRYDAPGPENYWKPVPRRHWRLDRAADTTEFASGVQLVLLQGGYPGQKVRVSYKAGFDSLTNESDDVLTVSGLHVEAHDILSLGAAYRLMGGSEAQRAYATSQADPRRGDEAPVNSHVRAMQAFGQMRTERIVSEQARLARMFPEALV